jgi:hypothetical protein
MPTLTPQTQAKIQNWLQVVGKSSVGVGLLLVLLSHSARVNYDLNTRLPGLAFLAAGLLLYAIYSEREKRVFGTAAATTLAILMFWMVHEQVARPKAVAEWRNADTIAVLVAAGALALGVYHEKQLSTTLSELANVQRTLSTRYLGPFPHFLPAIAQEIQRAQERVDIFCDYPAYGYYSDGRSAREYRHALEAKASESITIDLTCLNAALRHRYEQEQYSEAVWSAIMSEPLSKRKAEEFIRSRSNTDQIECTRDAFIAALDEVDVAFLRDVFMRRAKEIRMDIPLFFWIIDGRVAIFAVPTSPEPKGWEEYGFITSDFRLIQAFLEMRTRYVRMSEAAGAPAMPSPVADR